MSSPPSRSLGERRGSLRSRLVFLVALPVIVLGVSYFLFIEYVLQDQWLPEDGPWIALRIGGIVLIVISLLIAVTCGILLVDRVTRPVRLLLRLAETGELEAGRGVFLHHREWEIFQLYRRVHALVQENRSGHEARASLHRLQESLGQLRDEVQRSAPHGVLRPLGAASEEPLRTVVQCLAANRERLMEYVAGLRQQAATMRSEVEDLNQRVASLRTRDETESTGAMTTRGEQESADLHGSAGARATRETPATAFARVSDASNGSAADAAPTAERSSETDTFDYEDWMSEIDMEGRDARGIDESHPEIEVAFHSMDRIRELGTVVALEAELHAGTEGRRVGEIFEKLQTRLDELDRALEGWLSVRDELETESGRTEPAEARVEPDPNAIAVPATRLDDLQAACERIGESLGRIERRLAEIDAA